jgi:hypothetical protein
MGVSPPPLWLPPIAITPEKVITALSLSVGGDSRDRRSPFLQTSAFFISYDDKWNSKKAVSTEPFYDTPDSKKGNF